MYEPETGQRTDICMAVIGTRGLGLVDCCPNQMAMPVTPMTHRRQGQGDKKFKASLYHITNSRLGWLCNTVSLQTDRHYRQIDRDKETETIAILIRSVLKSSDWCFLFFLFF